MPSRERTFRKLLRNRWATFGLVVVALYLLVALFAPLIAPHDPTQGNLRTRLKPPVWLEAGSTQNLLGSDQLGRDVLSQVIHGTRASMRVGVGVVLLSGLVGGMLGLLGGYLGGRTDDILS